MSQKSKVKKEKIEEDSEQEPSYLPINKIHSKKQISGDQYFLTEFKGRPSKQKWQWKQQNQLKKHPAFKRERKIYLSSLTQKKRENSNENQKIEAKQTEKQSQQPLSKKIVIDKKALEEKFKVASNQQMSLDKFVNKVPNKQNKEQKKTESKTQQFQNARITDLNSKAHQQREQSQKNVWIDKIKSIKTIKAYEIKNSQILYHAEVWDNNGQTFFVPPLNSEAVRKIDETKLAIFLQDCLIRNYRESGATVTGR